MAKCGIAKYDELPSRVGWIDVDMNRWVLYRHNNPMKMWSWPYIGPVIQWLVMPLQTKEDTIQTLEKAYTRHHAKGGL